MRTLGLALRLLARDRRAGELRVLAFALAVAVASVSAVGFFTDRIGRAMNRQAAEILGADIKLDSHEQIPARYADDAARLGLGTARTLSLRSMVARGDQLQLVEVKAVGDGYPLRGVLRTAPEPFANDEETHALPERGTGWADARLLQMLNARVGDTLELGMLGVRITRVITFEPDRAGEFFAIAPRLLVALDDIPATGLVQPGSRVHHGLLVGGGADAIERLRAAWIDRLPPSIELHDPRGARPELKATIERGERFLGLASLVSVLLAGAAIALSVRRYTQRHLDACALMRAFGATAGRITAISSTQMIAVALAASLLGCALGYAVHLGLIHYASGLAAGALPAPTWRPFGVGLGVGLVAMIGFGLPPLLALRGVPPLRVLRRELAPTPPSGWLLYGSAAAALALLMLWQARDLHLTAIVLGGTLITLSVLAAVAQGLVHAAGRLRTGGGSARRLGIANLARRPAATVAQVVAFGLGITVLLLLTLVRGDLLAGWQAKVPPDAPNHFFVNLQPDQVTAVRGFFQEREQPEPELYPMVRGRLVAVNGREVIAEHYANPRAQRLVQREFNLSWRAESRSDNPVVAGRWWTQAEHGQGLASVEKGIAETLGLEMGDELRWLIGGREVVTRIHNLREVEWDSFRVNFFVLFPPGVLEGYPANYVSAVHVPTEARPLLRDLVQTFPNVTVIDVEAVLGHVRRVMDRAVSAVQLVFAFTLAAGLAVLYAALQSTLDERLQEGAVVRALGGSRAQLRAGLWAEFATLGGLAGLLAALAASGVGWAVAQQVFDLPYAVNATVFLAGLIGGALGVGIAGVLGTRAVVEHPPLAVLRE